MVERQEYSDPDNQEGVDNVEEMLGDASGMDDSNAANGAVDGPAGTSAQAAIQQERDPSTGLQGAGLLAAQYLDALQRERASFINYKRRAEQEKADTIQYATASLLNKLLPVMDDFDRALAAIPEDARKNNRWVEGVELIARKLHNILEQEGVEPIDALGKPFDPNLHEAVAFEDKAGESADHADTVSEVFSKGYKLRDRVLRPAMVKVSRG